MPEERSPAVSAEVDRLVAEQAALRRVATLVARGVGSAELSQAVSVEVARLFGSEAGVGRFAPDGAAVILVGLSEGIRGLSIGSRLELADFLASAEVRRTGRAARSPRSRWREAAGPVVDLLGEDGLVSSVSAPILVEGRPWGVIAVAETGNGLPPDAEARLEKFTELVATAIANAESRAALDVLVEEQAALRRVATLVARGAGPDEMFSAVSEEVGRLFGSQQAAVARFEPDGSGMVVVGATAGIRGVSIGTRWALEDYLASTAVYRTGRPARNEHTGYRDAPGPVADSLRQMHAACSVAAPIVVEGRAWGVMTVSDMDKPLPADAEQRLEKFTELVATAIAGAEARAELAASEARAHRLATEQAALRRVATLVAEGADPDAVFSAVTEEIEDVLGIPVVTVCRCEPEGFLVIRSSGMPGFPAGSRWPWDVPSLPGLIYQTGRAARIDDFAGADGLNAAARDAGVRGAVGVPIVVGGTVWGSICAATTRNEPLPADAEERLGRFRALLATYVSNTLMREELAASRARVIAAADDARRRIERDLHDGAQQRLVTLAVALRRAEGKVPAELDALSAEIARVAEGLATAVEELHELSRGIHPSVLAEAGLSPALKALGRRSSLRVKLDVGFERRLPDHVEVAAYYTVSEALTNAAKHARATRVWVSLSLEQDALLLSIRDDGVGGADASRGSGLTGLRDRIDALEGTFRVESPRERGTSIEARIPIGRSAGPPAEPLPMSHARP
jgi:signal transduction histidine kinase